MNTNFWWWLWAFSFSFFVMIWAIFSILLILIFNLTTWRHFGKKINIFLFMNLFFSSLTILFIPLVTFSYDCEITILFAAETSLSEWSIFFPFSWGVHGEETKHGCTKLGKAEIKHFLPRLWKTSNNRKLNNYYWSMSKCVILNHLSPFLHPVKSK